MDTSEIGYFETWDPCLLSFLLFSGEELGCRIPLVLLRKTKLVYQKKVGTATDFGKITVVSNIIIFFQIGSLCGGYDQIRSLRPSNVSSTP